MERTDGPTLERPFLWAGFAIGMLAIPVAGFVLESNMAWSQLHPAINALLNTTCAVFLVIGFAAIRAHDRGLHMRCMLTAFGASVVFLVSYLARFSVVKIF